MLTKLVRIVLLLSLCCWGCVYGWRNEELEMYDLVEELGSVTFYEFLGVSEESTLREIKTAYRQLSVKLHPDKNPDDPNAAVKFRQLVGAYEALKDEELRKEYHNVLEFGLPNWRQPIFYFRRAKKLAIWQVSLILLGIVTLGQYLASWGAWFERKLSLDEYLESSMKKYRKSKKAQKENVSEQSVRSELEEQFLKRPSIFNTAPFQLLRLGKYMVVQLPFDLISLIKYVQMKRKEEQEKLRQQKMLEEEELNIIQEPKKPRKRKTFQIPEKEEDDTESVQSGPSEGASKPETKKVQPVFVSGGLWTDDDITQLIKLCTKYPGGYPDRWNQISMIMCRPIAEVTHMAKKVLEDLSKKSNEEDEPPAPMKVKVKTKGGKLEDKDIMPSVLAWSKEEQKRLESALQMYPKNTVGDRWAKIASHVGKSKEECMQRYKHVAEMVKKKKQEEQITKSETEGCELTGSGDQLQIERSSLLEEESGSYSTEHTESNQSQASISRQNSSASSNGSGSDNEWCVVNSQA